jgi:hypothetical protein
MRKFHNISYATLVSGKPACSLTFSALAAAPIDPSALYAHLPQEANP